MARRHTLPSPWETTAPTASSPRLTRRCSRLDAGLACITLRALAQHRHWKCCHRNTGAGSVRPMSDRGEQLGIRHHPSFLCGAWLSCPAAAPAVRSPTSMACMCACTGGTLGWLQGPLVHTYTTSFFPRPMWSWLPCKLGAHCTLPSPALFLLNTLLIKFCNVMLIPVTHTPHVGPPPLFKPPALSNTHLHSAPVRNPADAFQCRVRKGDVRPDCKTNLWCSANSKALAPVCCAAAIPWLGEPDCQSMPGTHGLRAVRTHSLLHQQG